MLHPYPEWNFKLQIDYDYNELSFFWIDVNSFDSFPGMDYTKG